MTRLKIIKFTDNIFKILKFNIKISNSILKSILF